MNYPKIIDSSGKTLAILDNLVNPNISEQINGEYTFTFTAIIEELKTNYIHHDNIIEVDSNLFQIAKYTKERTSDNKTLIQVLAEHISYKLIDYLVPEFNYPWETALTMLQILLFNTEFELGTVNVAGSTGVQLTEEYTKREVLNHIANNFRGELEFDRYKINLLTKRGVNRGIEFRIGKNIKGIRKIVDNTKKDEQGNPYVSYEIYILELNNLEQYQGLEGFNIGDTVRIIDTDLGIDVFARIMEYEYDPIRRINSRVVLGNFIDSIAGELAEQRRRANLVAKRSEIWDRSQHITPQGTFLTDLLEGTIDVLNNRFNSSKSNWYTDEDGNIIFESEDGSSVMRLSGQGLQIANAKDINGQWAFRTFGSGEGFTADLITAGRLDASQVFVDNLTFGDLSGRVGGNQLDDSINNNIQNANNTASTANQTANLAKEIASKTNVNLLKNGGAEIYTGKSGSNIPDDWTPYNQSGSCTFTRRVTDPNWTISGRVSFEIVASSGIGVYYQEYYNPKIGRPYTLSAKLGAHRCDVKLIMRFTDANRNHLLAIESQVISANSTPRDLSVTGITPSGTGRIIVELWKYDTHAGQTSSYLFADNVKLEEGDIATPYIESDLSTNDAANAANTAQNTANTANSTANSALTVANNSVQKGVKFDNSIMIGNGNGIKVLDAANTARVTLGQYAAGKYGLLVNSGEIYGTLIRSGSPTATTYTEIGAGEAPIKVVQNGKKALELWLFNSGGSLNFYNTTADDMRMQMYCDAALSGNFRMHSRNGAGNVMPLNIDASVVSISTRPNAEEGELYLGGVYGPSRLFVWGPIIGSSKNAVEFTENYGTRLLHCTEMPEAKYQDEGEAELINGICRIDIDPILLETIATHNTESPWRIHLTPMDWVTIRVKEIGDTYFIVEEKEGLSGKFTWLLSAIRKAYVGKRFEMLHDDSIIETNWEDTIEDMYADNLNAELDKMMTDSWEDVTEDILQQSISSEMFQILYEEDDLYE